MRTRLVLFDIDGTLIRTGGAGVRAFARTAALVFGCPGGTDGLHFHGRTDVSLVREFLRLHRWEDTPETVRHFLDTYVHFLDEELQRHRGEICPGISDFLRQWNELESPPTLGLLTGNVRVGAALKLGVHGLSEAFELGAFGDDHEDRNELARIALERFEKKVGERVPGSEVVVIGDTRADIECARAIGARSVAVATGAVPLPELLEHSPTHAVESFLEMTPERLCRVGLHVERPADWDGFYRAKDTRWDKGEAAPGLVDFLEAGGMWPGQKVLVPGCGRGHDARAWAKAGAEVVALDLAPTAVAEAKLATPPGLTVRFEQGDFLNSASKWTGFDWVFEHTLFCAIPPGQRDDYVRAVRDSVRFGGHFLAIHYLQPSDPEGPPFGVSIAEVRERFEPYFQLVRHWIPRSFSSRSGRERMFLWVRRGSQSIVHDADCKQL